MWRILAAIGCLTLVAALFEDQAGKFDWRAQHIGCPNQFHLGQTKSNEEFLIVASEKNVVASVDTNTGAISWRQLNEENPRAPPRFTVRGADVLTILNNGEYVRVYDRNTGVLRLQQWFEKVPKSGIKAATANGIVAILNGHSLTGVSRRGTTKWTARLDGQTIPEVLDVLATQDSFVVVGGTTGKEFAAVTVDAKSGNIERRFTSPAPFFDVSRCIVSSTLVACPSGDRIAAVDVSAAAPVVTESVVTGLIRLHPLDLPGYVLAETPLESIVLQVSKQKLEVRLKFERTSAYSATQVVLGENEGDALLAAYLPSASTITVYDLKTGDTLSRLRIDSTNQAPIERFGFISSGKIHQFLATRRDCRVDFYEAQSTQEEASLEWSRFEALASISSVEMIDMPLSESQAGIETEFSAPKDPVWKMFLLRVTTQAEQFRRNFFTFADNFAKSLELVATSRASVTEVARNLFGYKTRRGQRPRAASLEAASEVSLERDYFNLRKLIVVTTLSGSAYGLHSEDGSVLWSLYLGDDAEPLVSQLGEHKVPLFVQRGTAHFQYASQAVVAVQLKTSSRNRLISFNPVTGIVYEKLEVDHLRSLEPLPFPTDEMLHPLLLVKAYDQVEFYPRLPAGYKLPYPVHTFYTEPTSGAMKGLVLDAEKRSLKTEWSGELALAKSEKVVTVAGKSIQEKVHSQGKVLGDRSVLYKYANPNLLAVATLNDEQPSLSIYMVDAVTGTIVHAAKRPHAQAPVHLVHCENWLVYTYWNSKARRTELGIIELYEGVEQTNAEHFNSLTSIKQQPLVFSQSYVFSQGISAIAASDTEQGLTTRSLLVAMPFGGILEVSRRFIDARRPLEMTPELREEMVIPYMPEIPIATEDLINYNQTAQQITGTKTAPSGLESTSLVLAYGLDMFFTRVTPSGTFDILKDDFDYALISLVLVVLVVASVVCKRLARARSIKQAWS